MSSVTFNFQGKTALVTGGSRGIGRATAKALSEAGAVTYALAKTQENLDKLVSECPSIRPICVDLTDWISAQKAIEDIPIDLLVNNAIDASAVVQPFLDIDLNYFEQAFNVNVKAVIALSQVVAKGMIARNRPGAIVNVSSMGSARAAPNRAIYCATKGALDQLTRVMAVDLGPYKIRVNSVHPTLTKTDASRHMWSDPVKTKTALARIPLGRIGEPEDIASAILYLLSDDARMIHGSLFYTDGGYTAW